MFASHSRSSELLTSLTNAILLLWDIDGTLITSGNAGMHALRSGLRAAFGIEGSLDDIDFSGRTDPWIIRRIFEKFDVPLTAENVQRCLDAYLADLPAALINPRAVVLPGIRSLLTAAARRPHLTQGILTGNVKRGAQIKLRHHDLWNFFPFGAFADDSEQRNELGPHAVRRAAAHVGATFLPEAIWIIGDTPHDIACGRAIGARTLAVATGGHSIVELTAHQPDAVLPDLSDHVAFWNIINRSTPAT